MHILLKINLVGIAQR